VEFQNFADYVLKDCVEIPSYIVHRGNLKDLLLFTQPLMLEGHFDPENAILTATHEHAEFINNLALNMIGGSTITLHSRDFVTGHNSAAMNPTEFSLLGSSSSEDYQKYYNSLKNIKCCLYEIL
jgi:hypothetical protein